MRKTSLGRRVASSALVVQLVVGLPGAALGQPSAQGDIARARELFGQASEQREAGDAKGALAKFKAAYSLAVNPITAIELGRTYEMVGSLIEARQMFLSIAAIPSRPDESARAAQAREEAPRLAAQVGARIPKLTVKIPGALPDLSIAVDGAAVPVALLVAPRDVNPGPHDIAATRAGGDRVEERVDLKEGESRQVDLAVPPPEPELREPKTSPVPPPSSPAVATPAPGQGGGGPGAVAYFGFGVGAVGFLTGGVVGLLAISKVVSAADSGCNSLDCVAGVEDELQSARTLGYVSAIAFLAAGAGVALGVAGLALNGSGGSGPRASATTVSPWVGPGAFGMRGSF